MTLKDLNLCIVDIETTGSRIIEVAALKIERGKLVSQFHTLINPEQPIPFSITMLTGIKDEDVAAAPVFDDIQKDLWKFLHGSVFVAHNVSFDYGFLRREFARRNVLFNLDRFCSVSLSRTLYKDEAKHDLSSIIDRYQIPLKQRHRALDDALGVWEFFKFIENDVTKNEQNKALFKVLRSSKFFPNKLPINIDHLPHDLGVFMLYDIDNVLLYVGKTNDLRSRVWDLLIDDKRFKRAARVDFIETNGKLSAALIEMHWIKHNQPLFNIRFKSLEQMTTLSVVEDKLGFKNMALETFRSIAKEDLDDAYMVFRTKRDAKAFSDGIAKKLTKTEATKQVVHNMRLIESLSKRRKITWPFAGPILINESNVLKTRGEGFIIDRWIIEQAFKYENEIKVSLFDTHGKFDFDTYRILYNYLLKADNITLL